MDLNTFMIAITPFAPVHPQDSYQHQSLPLLLIPLVAFAAVVDADGSRPGSDTFGLAR
jgi:hypothetical protein